MKTELRFVAAAMTLASCGLAYGCSSDAGESAGSTGTVDGGTTAPDSGESATIGDDAGSDASNVTASDFTIYGVGDSTMADYDPTVYDVQRGWGQMFESFLSSSHVSFVNAAKNGRGSRSFYLDPAGYWTYVTSRLKAGDYVLIQFAHNDEEYGGISTETYYGAADIATTADPTGRGTDPTTFKQYLGKYIDETRAKGATPIFVTPIVRRYFSGATLSAKALHDLSGTTATTMAGASVPVTDGNYVTAMKDVATSMNVPLIDMTASTKALVESYGADRAKTVIYIDTDDTHLKSLGATLFAELAVKEMLQKNLFTGLLNDSVDLVVSPTTADYGQRYVGTTLDKRFSATGLTLSPDSGNLALTTTGGFLLGATASGTFASTLQIPYTGGQLSPTDFFVRFAPTAPQPYAGTVTVTPQTGSAKTIALTGTGVAIPVGGTESTVVWPLVSAIGATATGLVTGADESLTGMYVKSYADVATWSPASDTTIAQRTTITGDAWPTETDIQAARYVQFAVTPSAGAALTVDAISFYAGGGGGSNLAYRALYSTEADFSGETVLGETLSNASNTMTLQTFTPIIDVPSGKTLYVRIYPWLKTGATGKYVLLHNVTVHGIAQ